MIIACLFQTWSSLISRRRVLGAKEVEMAEDLGLDLAGLGGPELQNLPVEVLSQIFGYLDPASVKTASLVSR